MSIWSSFGRRWVALPDAAAARLAIDAQQQSDALDNARETLTAARTYYVRTDGSDSNTGLVDSAGGAFLTVQKAIDTAAALDSSIYDVTIRIGAGTYSAALGNVFKNMVGAGAVLIVGDVVTPSNVVIHATGSMTADHGNFFGSSLKTTYKISGVKFTNAGTGATMIAINAVAGAYIEYGAVEFGAGFTRHVQAADYAYVKATASYTISAGAGAHIRTTTAEIRLGGLTVTLTGTPAFSSAFADTIIGGTIIATGITFSGAATGKRYNAATNSVIFTSGGGATYFPGDAVGTTATGGQYA